MLGSLGETNAAASSVPPTWSAGDAPAFSQPSRLLLASLSGAAGVIHLVMMPSHLGESAIEGIGFAIAGWAQLSVAVLALVRPSRSLLAGTIVLNALLICAWLVSRTTGLPWGEHAGHPESVSFIDTTCVALEAALIALAGLLLVRPGLGTDSPAVSQVVGAALPLGVLVLTTAALASPSARDHAAGSHRMHAHADDKGLSLLTNGHHTAIVQQEMDADTQGALDAQLAISKQVAARYPTVADAEAAGYRRAGPYSPGLGAHYISYGGGALNPDGVLNEDDLAHPLAIIYDGTAPDSRVAGFMYYSMSATEPRGFAGPNDIWHYHERICLKFGPKGQIDAPFGADFEATDAQCAAAGGMIMPLTQWMVHVWSVPGFDNLDDGVFAELNPSLKCSDGTYYQLPPDEWAANPLNVCRSGASVTAAD